jgi:hypothetical protein
VDKNTDLVKDYVLVPVDWLQIVGIVPMCLPQNRQSEGKNIAS